MSQLLELVPIPPSSQINTGMTPCPTHWLTGKFGMPRLTLNQECQPVSGQFWNDRMKTKQVHPNFKVTGHRLVVDLLESALHDLKTRNPPLHAVLGTAGMLCCRYVRGSTKTISNHGLGMAIDFKIDGHLDQRGDGKCFVGSLELYAHLKKYGFYWGAEFSVDDAMHSECCGEVTMGWVRAGKF